MRRKFDGYVQYQDTPEFTNFVTQDAAVMAKIVQRIGKVE